MRLNRFGGPGCFLGRRKRTHQPEHDDECDDNRENEAIIFSFPHSPKFTLAGRSAPVLKLRSCHATWVIAVVLIAIGACGETYAQIDIAPNNSQPNPYRATENWAKLPQGRIWGSTAGVAVDRHDHIWVAERCGANSCAASNLPPILEFNPSGKLLKVLARACLYFLTGYPSTKMETSG